MSAEVLREERRACWRGEEKNYAGGGNEKGEEMGGGNQGSGQEGPYDPY